MPDPSLKHDQPTDAAPPPPRKETILARYPRKLKLGAAGVIVVLLALPFLFGGSPPPAKQRPSATPIVVPVSGVDSRAAITNQSSNLNVYQLARNADKAAPGAPAASDQNAEAADDDKHVLMAQAPDPGLTEDTPEGSLPRISEDGRQPWQVYARPFNTADKRPRVAIVIVDLGLSRVATDAAINRLPPAVTLAFDAQSPVVGAWCARARQTGHETLLMVPMEPFDYPRSDPGPNTLLSNLPNSDNIARLLSFLREATGYIGITTLSGSRFTTDPTKLGPILDLLHKRGLMVFDARVAPHSAIADLAHDAHVPVASSTQRIDQNLAPASIDAALNQLEQAARLTGRAVGVAAPLPVVIDRLEIWTQQLQRDGIALAPLSAMVQ